MDISVGNPYRFIDFRELLPKGYTWIAEQTHEGWRVYSKEAGYNEFTTNYKMMKVSPLSKVLYAIESDIVQGERFSREVDW